MNRLLFIGLIIFVFLNSFQRSVTQGIVYGVEFPPHWPDPVYDFAANSVTENGFELGKALFYDPKLSRDGTISCANCHSQFNAFTHVDHDVSHGIEDRKGTRNSPVLINLAWNSTFHWDGGVVNLEMQPLNPLQHHAEMDNDLESVLAYLNGNEIYRGLFAEAFGDSLATSKYFLKALTQFTVSLVSSNSKYDKYKRGEVELTAQEFNGYKLFGKFCNSCHTEPLFTSNRFASNGLPMDSIYKDVGRYIITKAPADSMLFKIPTLRNIEYSFPYMHDGRFNKLKEVLEYYTHGIDSSDRHLSEELKKRIMLSDDEQKDIIAFLKTLSDKEFLFNPRFFPPEK